MEYPDSRKVDIIEDVRRKFEEFYTNGSYFNEENGDWWSDDYLRIIDLTTQKKELTEEELGSLQRAVDRFNEYRHDKLLIWLGELSIAFNSVAEQVNDINRTHTDKRRAGIYLNLIETDAVAE